MRRIRGLKDLVHDAVDATAALVGDAHEVAARKAMWVLDRIEPLAEPARVVEEIRRLSTRGVIDSVHEVNRMVARAGDVGLAALERTAAPAVAGPGVPMRSDLMLQADVIADAAIGALNGVVGDHLHERNNGLALDMELRLGDRYLAPEAINARRIAVFVHGMSATEWSWCLGSETYHGDAGTHFGTLLEGDLGYTPVFLRYNSGRHISHNGRQLAALLARLPCEQLVLIGHSMGGLVIRSACHYAGEEGLEWTERVTHICCLGSPHQGAPLEKFGNLLTTALGIVDVPGTFVPRRILEARSAGIKDLRFGYLTDEDWLGHPPDELLENRARDVPLLPHVTYAFIATTFTVDPDHPMGHALGDLMVRRPSARGPVQAEQHFDVHTHELSGVLHHQIQNHPDVYAKMLLVLRGAPLEGEVLVSELPATSTGLPR